MSEHEKQQDERFRHMTAAVDAIGRLMGTYDQDSHAQEELEKYRKLIMGVVYGEKSGTLGGENNSMFRDALGMMADDRMTRALKNMKTAEAAADLLAENALFHKLLGK